MLVLFARGRVTCGHVVRRVDGLTFQANDMREGYRHPCTVNARIRARTFKLILEGGDGVLLGVCPWDRRNHERLARYF